MRGEKNYMGSLRSVHPLRRRGLVWWSVDDLLLGVVGSNIGKEKEGEKVEIDLDEFWGYFDEWESFIVGGFVRGFFRKCTETIRLLLE